ncbi:helix-turn-helix domain-containing protein [Streptomyces sp. NPDC004288]|uniref:helix-turn-helix domain-containing protein n=1 Tax=unclassified Streptomyces TaxID=2593676 RepID=UPI003692A362
MTPAAPPGPEACSFLEREARLLNGLDRIGALSPREVEVLGLLRVGPTDAEVARLLRISAHTVRFHTKAIGRKLGGITRQEVCLVALAHHGVRRER